ncbi:MAG: hypothetical protein RIQ88_627 [Actinomycetota bacterium]|jgi:hypothetical protein
MSRAALALAQISLRFAGLFFVFSLIEAPALNSGGFGVTPIIPTAFLMCLNTFASLVFTGLIVAASLACLSPVVFSWRVLLAWILGVLAIWIGFAACFNVLLPS